MRRRLRQTLIGLGCLVLLALSTSRGFAAEPITIGFSMSLTGGSRRTARQRFWQCRSGRKMRTPKAACSGAR